MLRTTNSKNSVRKFAFASSFAAIFALVMTSAFYPKSHEKLGQGGGSDIMLSEQLEKHLEIESFDDEISEIEETKLPTFNLSYFSYRVKPGDMIGKIAQKFDISSDSIISLNGVKSTRNIQIGSYLKIPTMTGILYTAKQGDGISSVAEKFGIDAQKFASVNNRETSDNFSVGEIVFVPDAKMDKTTLQEINGDLFKKPIHAKWYRSSNFGWRSNPFTGARSYHSGIDMACPRGTTIFSAMAGTVTSTGYSPVYGNYVIVTHHSGYKTLYGHMDSILCVRGQSVNSESKIGKVGSTGMSTGPHLHFTVYKNNVAVNPAALWK